jgi:hypothetical protein
MITKNWIVKIDRITSNFKNEFGELTPEQLNLKPDENTWSIVQNIEHLIIVNESYFPVINAAKESKYKAPFISKFDFVINSLGKFILNSVQPDRKRKTKTFPMWKPSLSVIGNDILEKFEKHQSALKEMIDGSKDIFGKRIVISSPANRYVVYTLDTAFNIIIAHEERHFEQAKELLPIVKR